MGAYSNLVLALKDIGKEKERRLEMAKALVDFLVFIVVVAVLVGPGALLVSAIGYMLIGPGHDGRKYIAARKARLYRWRA